jgi:hypothetical protein
MSRRSSVFGSAGVGADRDGRPPMSLAAFHTRAALKTAPLSGDNGAATRTQSMACRRPPRPQPASVRGMLRVP